ncbi:Inositol-polyphosphate 4-phosphatase [Plasmopara halstedii]|uniref:Inositol-polyphosphate 4-phosphatase n=1 Tax=Plasmopara halstedii TaxID=4781 RepID=A0A0P1B820_PLAHL|nr:Inositol-polyphosphate 4-phosphatase [Plasmopara halstedii]CEG50385.1 Inositol-polyphosphate 4-phosphatase [Plasmopara halstedii]|eukprot:XP_024586754.1 Inositol-polyphosphate 4-phosphatase [Plasmopara halstedii]
MAAIPSARVTKPGRTTLYDFYPLSLRPFLAKKEEIPSIVRSKSHSMGDLGPCTTKLDDHVFHTTSASLDTLHLHDRRQPIEITSSDPFRTFQHEVFEPKERSKVLSVLRHRSKAVLKPSHLYARSFVRPVPPSTFTTDDILRTGFLTKQGSWRRNWKTRFFILRSDCPSLCYFTSEEKLDLLGDIAITQDTIILDRSGGHAPFRFQVRTDAQILLLEAATSEEQKWWIDSCQELADAIRATKFSSQSRPNNIESSGISCHSNDENEVNMTIRSTRLPGHRITESSASSSARSGSHETLISCDSQLYDLSIAIILGKDCQIVREVEQMVATEREKDRSACFVSVSGYINRTNTIIELGITDAIKLTNIVTLCQSESKSSFGIPFSLVLTTEIERYDELRFVSINSSFLVNPRLSQFQTSLKYFIDSNAIQLIVQAFESISPQSILPTSGIDMANTKYLIPTTLSFEREIQSDMTIDLIPDMNRNSQVRTFLENDTFLTNQFESGIESWNEKLRYVAIDEILRVPRCTYAVPIAFLDYLEEQALERSRWIQKQVETQERNSRMTLELEFLRKKQEEYLKQRQFLIRQEKRLVNEGNNGEIFQALKSIGMISISNEKETIGTFSSSIGSTINSENELLAPFKRSTYKNLNLWQFVPTNMQDQFICTMKPSMESSCQSFVWHTMTMGCPAAHTKGFTNGGYPMSESFQNINSNDDEPIEKSQEIESQSQTFAINDLSLYSQSHEDSLSALKQRLESQDRLSIISSQILSATIACLLASFDLARNGSVFHQTQLDRSERFGYFLHFESLLSTQGQEYGMLEDFAAGVRWLRHVFLQFRRHSTSGSYFLLKRLNSTGHDDQSLVLTMGLDENDMKLLPIKLQSGETMIPIHCVLFTQGVNEKQSLVHAYKSSAVKLQERVNRENLYELKRIYGLYDQVRTNEQKDCPDLVHFEILLQQIEHQILSCTNQYKKNVTLLMDTSDFCRALGGARVTCCKSGKDRTAMSVTLEQTRLLWKEMQSFQNLRLCANMRLYGVRRRNVYLNTKADKFAFNEMQRKMLPECFKPPPGTYKAGKT